MLTFRPADTCWTPEIGRFAIQWKVLGGFLVFNLLLLYSFRLNCWSIFFYNDLCNDSYRYVVVKQVFILFFYFFYYDFDDYSNYVIQSYTQLNFTTSPNRHNNLKFNNLSVLLRGKVSF